MELLGCGHVAVAGRGRMCRHLVSSETAGDDHTRHLTGHGVDADYLCPDCDRAPLGADLVEACEGCFQRHETGCIAWRGTPGIPERLEPVGTDLLVQQMPPIVDMAPMDDGWVLLLEDGLVALCGGGMIVPAGVCDLPDEDGTRTRLHCSPGGRMAAVVHDQGRYGQLLDLQTGAARPLDGGDYHCAEVPFSIAFLDDARAVTRTSWNRLVVFDARTGEELGWTGAELDYFHGALHASPGGRWIADDGWVWAPVGIVRVWDAALGESQDLCDRAYHWSSPMCWLGDDLLVVSGLGDDDQALLPGVRIFDVPTGTELIAFPGPSGNLFAAGRRLFSVGADGLEIWDPFRGERTGRVPGFRPQWHHRGAGELVALEDGKLTRWRIDQ